MGREGISHIQMKGGGGRGSGVIIILLDCLKFFNWYRLECLSVVLILGLKNRRFCGVFRTRATQKHRLCKLSRHRSLFITWGGRRILGGITVYHLIFKENRRGGGGITKNFKRIQGDYSNLLGQCQTWGDHESYR